jgi:SAM-dependent methyltransferase
MILPWFGGSSAVWSVCMLFFQTVLLVGYLYAHGLTRLRPRAQALVHTAVLAGSLAALPILPNPAWKTAGGNPSLRILAVLAVTVGLPYFLLSSTSPLLQAWYARRYKSGMPYRLFALSNFASMLALLSYPFLVEPNLPARWQALGWSAAYAGFAALCALTAWRSAGAVFAGVGTGMAETSGPPPGFRTRLLWTSLAACASVLLLAVTTHLTQDVAAIPFLWILPLSVYLASFIVCFEAPWLYRRAVFFPAAAAALAFMAWRLWPGHAYMAIRPLIACFAIGLFACCMVCHGELARRKPHPRYLTGFYVVVSLGGALGGLFVGLVAPNLFRAYYEFPLGLGLFAALACLALAGERRSLPAPARKWAMGALAVALVAYVAALGEIARGMVRGYETSERNFYGQLRVRDEGNPEEDDYARRLLVHGVINHGEQMLRPEYRLRPITYFCPQSGIGRAMSATEGRPRRVGILGLGCGTLAAYGRPGDTLTVYEINPQVVELARSRFTYLSSTPARVEVQVGDGRLLLEAERGPRFDILVMDAFSGDSVPVHLITREAFEAYFRLLQPDGILAVNISNKYLDLRPVMAAGAHALGKVALGYSFEPAEDDDLCYACTWALLMTPEAAAAWPELAAGATRLVPPAGFRPWTDDFSNLFRIMK